MARPALLAAALLACLVLAPAAGARVPANFVGITAEDVFAGDANYRTSNLSAQAAIGIQTIRQTFDWSTIERRRGRYDLRYHDDYVAKAAAHGIRIVPVLFRPPRFRARRRGRAVCPPRRNATFARFAKALVRRYGRHGSLWRRRPGVPKRPITSWQIWNEPNLGIYWCNRPNARRYVRMLRRVGRAIKRVDRRAHILTAGLPPSKLRSAVPLERYIKRMYRAGARRAFDSLAINSYAKNHRALRRLLRSVRRLMNRRRDRRGGIWITELGWGDRGPKHRFIVGAKGQAKRIRKSYAVIRKVRRRLRLRGVVYYSWRDAPPYPPRYKDLWGLHTGLLDINGGFKPAFHSFKNAVARLR
ncbi:MAG: hypothetical protein ACRDL0_03125 [Thermoleophilaceae bacterium]